MDLRSLFAMIQKCKHWSRHPGSIKPTLTVSKTTIYVEVGD